MILWFYPSDKLRQNITLTCSHSFSCHVAIVIRDYAIISGLHISIIHNLPKENTVTLLQIPLGVPVGTWEYIYKIEYPINIQSSSSNCVNNKSFQGLGPAKVKPNN